jgi:membrane protein implicated in regulation of membrane protease activity
MFKRAFIVGFVLTVATWALVYISTPTVPLDGKDTTVVFGCWFAVTLFVLWFWTRFRKRSPNDPKTK